MNLSAKIIAQPAHVARKARALLARHFTRLGEVRRGWAAHKQVFHRAVGLLQHQQSVCHVGRRFAVARPAAGLIVPHRNRGRRFP